MVTKHSGRLPQDNNKLQYSHWSICFFFLNLSLSYNNLASDGWQVTALRQQHSLALSVSMLKDGKIRFESKLLFTLNFVKYFKSVFIRHPVLLKKHLGPEKFRIETIFNWNEKYFTTRFYPRRLKVTVNLIFITVPHCLVHYYSINTHDVFSQCI